MKTKQHISQCDDETLTRLAKRSRPRLKRWVSAAGGNSQRVYVCNLCDRTIDSESAQHPMTKHAYESICQHRDKHLAELTTLFNVTTAGGEILNGDGPLDRDAANALADEIEAEHDIDVIVTPHSLSG